MSEERELELYKLAKSYDEAKDKTFHIRAILDSFLQLTKIEQMDVIDHYFTEVRHAEQLKLIQKELFDEETIVKRHDQEVKLWLFKIISVFSLIAVFFFLFIIDTMEHINSDGTVSTLESLVKFLKLMFS